MGYSNNPEDVRVDFFKPSGKWYCTEKVRWTAPFYATRFDALESFARSLQDHFKDQPDRLSDMTAVCLNPYRELAYPLMIKDGGWVNG